jgi:hypothetical protein
VHIKFNIVWDSIKPTQCYISVETLNYIACDIIRVAGIYEAILKLKLIENNITFSLDCVKIKTYVYTYCLSHKLCYMLLGMEFVFLFSIRRVLGGSSRSYL